MNELLTHDHFLPYVGSQFTFDGQTVTLVLRSVEHGTGSVEPCSGRTPFLLLFAGPRAPVMPEGHSRAIAPDGTAFEFYINPIHTPARDRQDYQAVFN